MFRSALPLLSSIIGTASATYVFTTLCFSIASINGKSMQPELNITGGNTDIVLVNHIPLQITQIRVPERGRVAVIRSPTDPQKTVIKRIIAVENETIIPREDKIYVYKKNHVPFMEEEPILIPKGHCWVEGDNAASSTDSNSFGAIPVALIQGYAEYVIYPHQRSISNTIPKETRK
ncbi:mitochondrial inner membrane protease subunit 2, partial [Acrasis kona]